MKRYIYNKLKFWADLADEVTSGQLLLSEVRELLGNEYDL